MDIKLVSIIGGVFGILLLISGGINYWQHGKITKLERDITTCNADRDWELKLYNEDREKANKAIDDQNTAIREFALNKEQYETTINIKEKELLVSKINSQNSILKELEKDPSSDNQIKILTNMLKEFSNESH